MSFRMFQGTVFTVGRALPPLDGRPNKLPDWRQADPRWIEDALARALRRPAGGWYALDAARAVKEKPQRYTIAGQELVVWRANGEIFAAPNACPHLGGPLCEGSVRRGHLVCPWHGLMLGPGRHGSWKPLPTFNDGVLLWVQLDNGEEPSAHPALPARPMRYFDAVVRQEARCAPEDILANRLDPWHNTHIHPRSFAHLRVVERQDDELFLRLVYRVLGPLCLEVDAHLFCPNRRSVVLTILEGEGAGSVIETHVTPLEAGRTAILEAILAVSERRSFPLVLSLARWIRPWAVRAAGRLLGEDLRYAERLYQLRAR